MKLWIDDVRPAPKGYIWLKSVNEAKAEIRLREDFMHTYYMHYNYPYDIALVRWGIELIDIDHDAGDCTMYGGDYIKLLDWLEETGRNYPIRIHSANPVGVENMRRIIKRNGWTEVK